jgi:hypothetical protein
LLDGLRDLVDLSRLDTEISRLEEERGGLPGRLRAAAAEREAAQARLEAARAALVDAEQAQRRAESQAQDHEALLRKLEGQQHQIKTNTAYTALLGEMEQARRAISDAETHVLEAMEVIEASRSTLAEAGDQVRGVLERIAAEERRIEERGVRLAADIASLQAQRAQRASGIERTLLARYDRIASRRRPAVAIVSGEICLGCRVGIPPQSHIEILKGEEIVTCGTCTRILILEDQLRDIAR